MASEVSPGDSGADALEALMAWYDAMGVDTALEDVAVDRFAESAAMRPATARGMPADRAAAGRAAGGTGPGSPADRAPYGTAADRGLPGSAGRPAAAGGRPPEPAQPITSPGAAALPGDDAVMAARAAAASAGTLEALKALLGSFDGCNLKLTAKTLVFGDGNPAARVMFVGEAPGRDEDIEGRPFVGRSGQLLDRMLAAIGLDRARDTYIGNVIYWRPPGNRDPSDQEVAICRPFIRRQIELVDPDVLVFLGAQPAKALMGGEAARMGIRKLRGHWMDFDNGRRVIRALPTFHPAYLLRNPIEKRFAWRDMLALKAALDGSAAPHR